MEEGQNESKIGQKRMKSEEIMEKKGEVCALPDCLLIEILSRLPSTKDAIRTGTLSKRWERLWTLLPTLIFRIPPRSFGNPNYKSDFVLLVSKTLIQCPQLNRKKFEVRAVFDTQCESDFNNWIRYAISCNVEELIFNLWGSQAEFLLDQSIFHNSCFTNLRLEGCKLNPTGAIIWKNLRSLSISNAIIDEELLVNIVSGTPLLETLVLEYCIWPDITSDDEDDHISAPTSLSLAQCSRLEQLKKFKLNTSYGIKFQSQLNNWIRYAIRCNVQQLDLILWNNGYEGEEDEFVLDQIVFTTPCITELRLYGCMLNPVGAIKWKSLRSLWLYNYQSLDEDLIQNILSGSLVLETLVLEDCYGYRRLDITSKSVKNLELHVYKEPYDEYEADIVEINAPNILSLSVIVDPFLCKPLLLNVSSVVKAYLEFACRQTAPTEAEQEILKGCIMNLRHVKELELGFFCSQVLSCLQAKGFVSPPNVKLKVIGVTTDIGELLLHDHVTEEINLLV